MIYKKSAERRAIDFVGGLAFKKNRVAWVSKSWGGFEGKEVVSFANDFAGILAKLIEKGKTNLTVHISEVREPEMAFKSIDLISGRYRIILTISDGGISMTEQLSTE
jgi:hypothetical protein